jgi:formyltetrahydrofolate deformylase
MNRSYRLIISCPDTVGIVAAVSAFVAANDGTITEANHYTDPVSNWFFMRHVIAADSLPFDLEEFRSAFAPIAERYSMEWCIADTANKPKVVLMVSKQSHCLTDLLYRWKSGDMDFEIPAVISNHEDMRDYVEWHNIPYHHVPITRENKDEGFNQVAGICDEVQADTIVLARYMQIIPPWFCDSYPNRIINIHHSFLPSFAGAKPYHQALERGVKLTGATCHYVTQQLDEGPIIEQDVVRISHHNSIEEIVRLGKDVEKTVLARGLRYHLENRVLIHGHKTIVFA